jgi:hypothetical protein
MKVTVLLLWLGWLPFAMGCFILSDQFPRLHILMAVPGAYLAVFLRRCETQPVALPPVRKSFPLMGSPPLEAVEGMFILWRSL